ncbi:hypothetical protein JX265_013592 [Neoarthrinium moseri]|uniref:DCG1 protein n=1 Tax=Neoarthrinium moseri TaxID=1658444 RepID=A0A9P9W8B4_9PEZI|nr:uncharacterized protein JN550_002937 [Neoarthrinium moseri]KAI1842053.1 hypothetical protein JX266_011704 [Neoarthrinium moseri]KAI1849586.1 hypothetical protein JX265_013592 [Neoarthrinium moseri]KAI1874358.1 hypothetical protein JN550_002937 [Neoarthrinium moseri]
MSPQGVADGGSYNANILVLNPNSSKDMTETIETAIGAIPLSDSTSLEFYTAPSAAPPSINDGDDIAASTVAVLADGWWDTGNERSFAGMLVACYSVHPLVGQLRQKQSRPVVTGIFEASILTALALLRGPGDKWGIVTTGKWWEEHLANGVLDFLGAPEKTDRTENSKFAGVESTGLNASDFHHGVAPEVVNRKIRDATKRLLAKGNVTCIVMGCAGMAGMKAEIQKAAREARGEEFVRKTLSVVDGVGAGILQLQTMITQQRVLSM